MGRKKTPPLCFEQGGGAFSPGGELQNRVYRIGFKTKLGSNFV
jgi:hypothetical protein